MGYLLTSHTYNVPKSLLQDGVKKIKSGKAKDEVFPECPATQKSVCTDGLEGKIVEHIINLES